MEIPMRKIREDFVANYILRQHTSSINVYSSNSYILCLIVASGVFVSIFSKSIWPKTPV